MINNETELLEAYEEGRNAGIKAERNRIRLAIAEQYPHTDEKLEPCIRCDLMNITHIEGFLAEKEDVDLRERLAKLIEKLPFIWMGDIQLVQISRSEIANLLRNFGSD